MDVVQLLREARERYATVRATVRVADVGDVRRVAEATFRALGDQVPFADVLDVEKVAAFAEMVRSERPEEI